jgi:hypothetical protein
MKEPVVPAANLVLIGQQAALTAGCGLGFLTFLAFLTTAHSNAVAASVALGGMSSVAFLIAGLLTLRVGRPPSPRLHPCWKEDPARSATH